MRLDRTLALVTVLGKIVYDITSEELDLRLLGPVEFAPAALLALVTGSVADRFSRQRVAAVAYLGEGAGDGRTRTPRAQRPHRRGRHLRTGRCVRDRSRL